MTNKVLAKEGAISCGINLDFECAWIGPPDNDGFTPFGPDANKDNIFQNMPQVNLHGWGSDLKNVRKYFERSYQRGDSFA